MNKIGIHGRELRPSSTQYVSELFDLLHEAGKNIVVSEIFISLNINLFSEAQYPSFNEDNVGDLDCILSLGGDGTILDSVTLVGDRQIPILGINTGRLGFLATIAKDHIRTALQAFLTGKFTIDKRTLLSLDAAGDFFDEKPYALNELAILKRETSSMIVIKASLNGVYLNTYWADGLMVSTPTGSTGYSLSCGGPILVPHASNFLITPVSPHNLNVRPLVVPDNSEIIFKVENPNNTYLVSLDSRSNPIEGEMEFRITKATFQAHLIRIEGDNFIDTLKNKLSWGLDKRN